MGLVLEAELPSNERKILLAIANRVQDDGKGCYADEKRILFETKFKNLPYYRRAFKAAMARGLIYPGQLESFNVEVWNIDLKVLAQYIPVYHEWVREEYPVIQKSGQGTNASRQRTEEQDYVDSGDEREEDSRVSAGVGREEYSRVDSKEIREKKSQVEKATREKISHNDEIRDFNSRVGDENARKSFASPAHSIRNILDSVPDSGKTSLKTNARGSDGRVENSGPAESFGPDEDFNGPAAQAADPLNSRPSTELERLIARLTQSRNILPAQRSLLNNTVTAPAKKNRGKPVTHASPEDQFRANPDEFTKYVELCAQRISEETSKPPSRGKLIASIRNYARHGTGWLDYKRAKDKNIPGKLYTLTARPGTPRYLQ